MITVEEAFKIVLDHKLFLETETVPLESSTGRILQETIVADRDFPPYNRVTMDGIAIDHDAYRDGKRTFPIVGVGAAGMPQKVLSDNSSCLEIMTGAILPVGTDTVIRYEDLTISEGKATINIETVQQGQNVHRQGEDRKQDEEIIHPGTKMTAAEIGVAATVGKYELKVLRNPRICLISTGDEVVDIRAKPAPHQIRTSNTHAISSLLASAGFTCDRMHLPDNRELIEEELGKMIGTYDILVLSGGVSKGKFDFIPEALERLGVQKHFHRIKQRPGKPFWFGSHAGRQFVFALPGNPVSAMMCATRYMLPWIRSCQGIEPIHGYAYLGEEVHFKPDLTYFVQSRLVNTEEGKLIAMPITGNGSGDLASLTGGQGFVELPLGRDVYPAGEVFRFWHW